MQLTEMRLQQQRQSAAIFMSSYRLGINTYSLDIHNSKTCMIVMDKLHGLCCE